MSFSHLVDKTIFPQSYFLTGRFLPSDTKRWYTLCKPAVGLVMFHEQPWKDRVLEHTSGIDAH